jgi:hypothetical protein
MCSNSQTTVDLEVFQERLAPVIASARSLDEVKAWLTSQPFIVSVELADYL